MQTTSRMTVNVFNLVNGSYKSKHCQAKAMLSKAHPPMNTMNKYLAKCKSPLCQVLRTIYNKYLTKHILNLILHLLHVG